MNNRSLKENSDEEEEEEEEDEEVQLNHNLLATTTTTNTMSLAEETERELASKLTKGLVPVVVAPSASSSATSAAPVNARLPDGSFGTPAPAPAPAFVVKPMLAIANDTKVFSRAEPAPASAPASASALAPASAPASASVSALAPAPAPASSQAPASASSQAPASASASSQAPASASAPPTSPALQEPAQLVNDQILYLALPFFKKQQVADAVGAVGDASSVQAPSKHVLPLCLVAVQIPILTAAHTVVIHCSAKDCPFLFVQTNNMTLCPFHHRQQQTNSGALLQRIQQQQNSTTKLPQASPSSEQQQQQQLTYVPVKRLPSGVVDTSPPAYSPWITALQTNSNTQTAADKKRSKSRCGCPIFVCIMFTVAMWLFVVFPVVRALKTLNA